MIRYFTRKLIKLILFLFLLSCICSGHSVYAAQIRQAQTAQPMAEIVWTING